MIEDSTTSTLFLPASPTMTAPKRYRPVDRLLYSLVTLYSIGNFAWLVWSQSGNHPYYFELIVLVGGLLPGIATCILIAYQISAPDRRRPRFSPTATLIALTTITVWFLAVWYLVASESPARG